MIRTENLGVQYEGQWVFRNVSFAVPEGETMVLLGPSGAGKSVLIRTLSGLIAPAEGTIDIQSDNVGMLFQKNALFDSLSVEENLLFPLEEYNGKTGKEAKERTRYFLDAVGLSDSAHLFPHEISGGMQKRLGIARALIVEPKVILYDDPTAGLDPVTSRIIASLVTKLRNEWGGTVVVVTNDMQRALQLGDRIGFLADGSFRWGGTPDEVQQTKDPALKQFFYGLRDGPLTRGLE